MPVSCVAWQRYGAVVDMLSTYFKVLKGGQFVRIYIVAEYVTAELADYERSECSRLRLMAEPRVDLA